MRGMLAGLVVALMVVIVALLVATLGAVGVAAIGWLLHRWFDLTQWQGSLVALAVALGVGHLAYRMATTPETREPEWLEWDDLEEDGEAASEPPVVPWRRRRPTQGELPPERRQQKGSHSK